MNKLAVLICIFALAASRSAAAHVEPPLLTPDAAKATILSCMAEIDVEQQAPTSDSTDAERPTPRNHGDCIGVASDPCQKANGYTTYAMLECIGEETEAWDALMTEWMAQALDGASPGRRAVLEESQKAWQTAMERSLDIYDVQYADMGGGSIWGVLAIGDAEEMTARRALWIHGLLEQF